MIPLKGSFLAAALRLGAPTGCSLHSAGDWAPAAGTEARGRVYIMVAIIRFPTTNLQKLLCVLIVQL